MKSDKKLVQNNLERFDLLKQALSLPTSDPVRENLLNELKPHFVKKDADGKTLLDYAFSFKDISAREYISENMPLSKDDMEVTINAFNEELGKGKSSQLAANLTKNLNKLDEDGKTLLHYAAASGKKAGLEYLINKKLDVNALDDEGRSPLDLAIETGNLEIVQVLIAKNSKVEIRHIKSAIELAKNDAGRNDIAKILIEKSTINDVQDQNLNLAVDTGNVEIAEYILKKLNDNPISLAISKNNSKLIDLLIKERPEYLQKDNNKVAFEILNSEGPELKRKLFQGASPKTLIEMRDKDGNSLLHIAVKKGDLESVKAIIAKCSLEMPQIMHLQNKEGQTAIHFAINNDIDIAILEELAKHDPFKTSMNINNIKKESPLSLAIEVGSPEKLEILLANSTRNEVNQKDANGKARLELAIEVGSPEKLGILLRHCSAREINQASNGKTPLELAIEKGNPDLIRTFIASEKIGFSAIGDRDKAPLELAIEKGNREIIDALILKIIEKYNQSPEPESKSEFKKLLSDGFVQAIVSKDDETIKTIFSQNIELEGSILKKSLEIVLQKDSEERMELNRKVAEVIIGKLEENSVDVQLISDIVANGYNEVAENIIASGKVTLNSENISQFLPLLRDSSKTMNHIIEQAPAAALEAAINTGQAGIARRIINLKKVKLSTEQATKFLGNLLKNPLENERIIKSVIENTSLETLNAIGTGESKSAPILITALTAMLRHNNNLTPEQKESPEEKRFVSNFNEIISQLIDKGVDLDREQDGYTAISLAIQAGNAEIIGKLIEKGARLDIADGQGKLPIHLAIESGNADIIDKLIDNGANLTKADEQGKLPIHLAVEQLNLPLIQKLLEKDKSVINAQDKDGNTPLHILADPNSKLSKKEGEADLDDGERNDEARKDIAELLIKNGASRKIKNNELKTAGAIATENGVNSITAILNKKESFWTKVKRALKNFHFKDLFKSNKEIDTDLPVSDISASADPKKPQDNKPPVGNSGKEKEAGTISPTVLAAASELGKGVSVLPEGTVQSALTAKAPPTNEIK